MSAPSKATVRYIKAKGKFIGQGICREVFKTPRGKWVLKVNKNAGRLNGNNRDEYEAYMLLSRVKLPEGVKLPEMYLFGDDLVAQFVKGYHPKTSCSPDYHSSRCEDVDTCYANRFQGWKVSIADLHNENVIIGDDGNVYLIDLGFGVSNTEED
jgi:tRNA A-37 threonylcarbamoyl transferase component Bud32